MPSPLLSAEDAPSYEHLYYLNEQELAFFQSQTGIQNEDDLKQHIMDVRTEALKVTPYTCIKAFVYTKLIASRLPAYPQAIQLGIQRKGAIWLDIGCCFGVDVRKAVADGIPAENAIGSDIHPEYWDLGHRLFRTTSKKFPASFLGGDAFDPDFFRMAPPLESPPEGPPPTPATLSTLTPLNGHVSIIHVSSVFHLFDEEQQLELARKLAGLLSPLPGSTIIGLHVGRAEKGLRTEGQVTRSGNYMFCHSPDSWKELWDGTVFQKGKVEVKASLLTPDELLGREAAERGGLTSGRSVAQNLLVWSVTRL
ncbi:hypothetical protein DAEQUDRAFT_742273 [Daedalea quercina L-15889]|uniref:Methyltransferase domain-containing protein n=1 Tax=Daedalea quercina L-15889 TaxID=1314783 RepID=A0A165UEZ1_9APHY|nr:hypothetical protein DAEQUDRAFT_742273 [Daedalea quercina L-15889]